MLVRTSLNNTYLQAAALPQETPKAEIELCIAEEVKLRSIECPGGRLLLQ
jgi:hypothetical protein